MTSTRPPQPTERAVAWKPGPRTARSRSKLIDAAKDVFLEHGFDGARVGDIASAAGVSRGTFYLYFPSKHDVLLAIGVNCVEGGQRLARNARAIPDDWVEDDLRTWLVGLLDHLDRFGAFGMLWRQQVPEALREQGIKGEHSTATSLGRELTRLRGTAIGEPLHIGLAYQMMTEGLWHQHRRAPHLLDRDELLDTLVITTKMFLSAPRAHGRARQR
ncbi:MAG: TetR/AcrR family transcriptional regulator [Acidimicrobiia bacterium]